MIQARIARQLSPEFSLDIEFATTPGITVLFGPSEAGKTTTLDCIAGFLKPDRGRILLDDVILFDAASNVNLPPRQRKCGYVFAHDALFPHMTLRQNLLFAAGRRGRLERHRRAGEMLERFQLVEVSSRRPHQVSGLQRQSCSIARALMSDPVLLLLDEPPREVDTIVRQLWLEFQLPILVATRDLGAAFGLGDALLVLHRGRVVQSGPPRRVLDQPANAEVARLLGIANLFEAEIKALDPGRNTSRLQLDGFELTGPYFPGRLLGDRVWLCAHAEDLKAAGTNGARPGTNQVPVKLLRIWEKPGSMRLEFSHGIRVEIPQQEFARQKDNREWLVEFPPNSLRVL